MSTDEKGGTSSRAFGTSGRISHDSSRFYNSRLYEGRRLSEPSTVHDVRLPAERRDQLYCKSSQAMTELPDHSVHLMITSPPYNVQKEYDEDLTMGEHLDLLSQVMAETHRVLATGGRACLNLANLGRKPYLPINTFVTGIMLDLGFLMRGEIIWDKGSSAGSSTAWGTWQSAANPVLRDVHEYILVFSKDSFRRTSELESSIGRDEFLEYTKSVWSMPAESARRIGHPAPFPEALPRRLIELYSFPGDVVLDPFCGSGTTCVAAARAGRSYVGYDTEQAYLDIARRRLGEVEQVEN